MTRADRAGRTDVRKGLDTVLAIVPQLTKTARWKALMHYIIDKIIAIRKQNQPPPAPTLTLPSNTPLGKPHGTRHSATTPKSVCI